MSKELIKRFVEIHSETEALINEKKVNEARKKYMELMSVYHELDKSPAEKFHKDLAYDQVTQIFHKLNEVKKKVRIPANLVAAAVLIIALSLIVILRPSIVGLLSFEDEINQQVNLAFNGTTITSVTLKDKPLSLAVSGQVTGDAKLYLKRGEQILLIFDSAQAELDPEGRFEKVCIDTCTLTTFDIKNIELFSNVEADSTLLITNIIYNIERKANSPPAWTSQKTEFRIKGETTINLSEHFKDPEGDTLVFLSTEDEGIEIGVKNEIVTIIPDPGVKGEKHVTFIASDLDEVAKAPVKLVIE